MGQKSEFFCRQALSVLARNPQIVPPSLGLAEARQELSNRWAMTRRNVEPSMA